MNYNTETLYDSFNARNTSIEQVAKTFIINKQYHDLIDGNHALLMGPRGSGKTTLLKMLTPKALYLLDNELQNKVPFYGVYIPTDNQFKKQLSYLERKLDKDSYSVLSSAIETTNILTALVKTFSSIKTKNSSKDNDNKEIKFSKDVIEYWKLQKPISPTIFSIEQALRKRTSLVKNTCTKLIYTKKKSISFENLSDFFFDDFLSLCDLACSSFENIFLDSKETRWALCFDELELAPSWLQEDLLSYIRSVPQRFIFKLTTSPVISLSKSISKGLNTDSATHSNDYKIIRTWPINNNEIKNWNIFCKELVLKKIERELGSQIDPKVIFGGDNLDRSSRFIRPDLRSKELNTQDSYGYRSLNWYLIKDYATVDSSFNKYLKEKGIDAANPSYKNENEKDTIFRKIKPIVYFRYSYRNRTRARSRKNPVLYYGIPLLYEICDGNPRHLIGLLDELIGRLKNTDPHKPITLEINIQSEVIYNTSSRFLKLLATNPDANVQTSQKTLNAGEFLLKIGNYFHERLIYGDFDADPVGSIIVDEKVDSKYIELIEFALSHGALLYADQHEGVSNSGVRGKTFRLSYLLSPIFKLPKRDYKEVKLSTILDYKLRSDNNQLNLF